MKIKFIKSKKIYNKKIQIEEFQKRFVSYIIKI